MHYFLDVGGVENVSPAVLLKSQSAGEIMS